MAEARPRPRGSLSREEVLDTAVRLVDRDGLATLTMRRLAAELGVEAMAIYHHVADKHDLLDGVADTVAQELDADPEVPARPEGGWQEYLVRLAHGVRRTALTHPQAFRLVADRPTAEPGLRPPLRTTRWTDRLLAALAEHGFREEAAVAAYRAFTSFLLGHLLVEVADTPTGRAAPQAGRAVREPDQELAALDGMRAALTTDHSAEEFEASLEALLDHLETLRTQPAPPGGP